MVGLVQLPWQVQVAVPSEVVMHPFDLSEQVPHFVADQVLDALGQPLKTLFDVITIACRL